MDDLDRASEISAQLQDDALSKWRRGQETGPGSLVCIECEEEIPEARRKAAPSCVRCIKCQSEFENK